MRAALALARRGLGGVWPNPAVGCVIVKDGHVVGRGWTQPGGRPHAETEALGRAGAEVKGATAYVTLEPCAHTGETGPCAEALARAGVARVVAAMEDPDPRVAGQGTAMLEAAGIAVETGLCAEAAADVNAGYLMRLAHGRPIFTLKSATSLDGRTATADGESQWITGAEARALGHGLRLSHDATLVGSGTAVADDPMLTCRLPGVGDDVKRVRIVVDGRLRLPLTSQLVETAGDQPVWLATLDSHPDRAVLPFADKGVEVIRVAADKAGHPDLRSLAQALGEKGLTRVLIEGGAEIAAAFLAADLVDALAVFRAPLVLGGAGAAQIAPLDISSLAAAPRFERVAMTASGPDLVETYRRRV